MHRFSDSTILMVLLWGLYIINITAEQQCQMKDGSVGICKANHLQVLCLRQREQSQNCSKVEVCCKSLDVLPRHLHIRSRRTSSSAIPSTIPTLKVKGCGIRTTLGEFIVGGEVAEYWPWMGAIYVRRRSGNVTRFQCGGTVISKRYILTAAHCMFDMGGAIPPARVTVRVGGLTTEGDGYNHEVTDVVIHQNYSSRGYYDDIALLRLSEEIVTKNVAPACLPTPGMYDANFHKRNATVLGWGATSEGGPYSSVLKEAIAPIIKNKDCAKRYERLGTFSLPRGIISTQICAGTTDGSADACKGDSGGPLLVRGTTGRYWYLIGVVSFGFGCANPEYPGVYARVPKYLPWLQDNTDISSK